ncbi:fungal-specific transcription factor domain-containing protein, partial [Ilyonectria destructans]
ALLLPSTSVYDQLIKTYFQWVHPFIPVLDRDAFMVQNDGFPNLPISPLLIQAMLLAASRFNPLVHLHNNEQASFRFYEKFETLYNANYEADSIIVVQATALVAWHCGFSKETYAKSQYWITAASNVAFRCAKGNFYNPVLDTITIRLWRRIWWGLFIQDRTIALVANTPVSARIHAEELDELTENDFYERSSHLSDEDFPSLASFFLDYVELCKIMDRIIVARDLPTTSPKSSETRRFLSFTLRGWLVRFKKAQSSGPNVSGVGRAFLHATFNTLTYEVHSCTLTPVRRDFALVKTKHLPDEIIRTAAECITTTARSLLEMKKLSYCPGLIAHSLCCAIAAHIYRLETLAGGVSEVSTRQNLTFCVEAWGYLAKSWNV